MKLLITVIFFICLASAKKQRPRKLSSEQAKAVLDELTYTKEQQIYNINDINDQQLGKEITKEAQRQVKNFIKNPCSTMKCNQGQICALNENFEPTCTCAEFCTGSEIETNICDSANVTYPSECEFYRRKCLTPKILADVELDYYGSCLDVEQMCSPSDLLAMPSLLQQWFYMGMGELTQRDSLELTTVSLLDSPQSQKKTPKRMMKFLRYRFNMLDDSAPNRMLSDSELIPVRAPLVAVQPCVVPFLKSCDTNEDGYIHMDEWLECFK
ncbi:SPARC-like [Antedon mediterranea]|uniref:SPARC-like n=1 Tax=Antedon mediterranea TaxID=105859 RepID=UPI003AF9B1AA